VAWNSGAALTQFVQSIGGNYAVEIIGHSLGNAVVGAALSNNGMQINGYAMLHAAVSASCYSQTNPPVSAYPVRSTNSVPDTDSDSFTRSLGYTGHLGGVNNRSVTNGIVNYFDEYDPVINAVWDANNTFFKPQKFDVVNGYGYVSVLLTNINSKVYLQSVHDAERSVVTSFEAMPYVDFSLTGSIGGNTNAAGSVGSQVNEDAFQESLLNSFNAHSYEFLHPLSDPAVLLFYNQILQQFGIPLN
jgi:hypothetical protein